MRGKPATTGPAPATRAVHTHNTVWRSLALRPSDFSAPAAVEEALRSPGRPLNPDTRAEMESSFGQDLGHVRLHTGARAEESAQSVGARAYTVGSDIVFGRGAYAPSTTEGRRLLSHEMAHTVQQQGAASRPASRLEVSRPEDAHEVDAERAAESVTSGKAARPARADAPHVARQPEVGAAQAPAAGEQAKPAPSSAVLPFEAKMPGAAGGWDSATILSTTGIDASSQVGKAVSAGPKETWELAHQLSMQTAAELKAQTAVDEHWAALFQASMTCSLFGITLTLLTATYAELASFASLSDALSKQGPERKSALVSWSKQQTAAPAQVAPAAAPQAAPPAKDAATVEAENIAAVNKPPGAWAPAYTTQKTHTGLTVENYQKAMGTGDFSKGQGIELLKSASSYGGTPRKTMTVTIEQLFKIFPDLETDSAADKTVRGKVDNYLTALNQAFKVMMINTVEAQAAYLAHAYVESDQFRRFSETTTTAQRYLDDPKQAKLDEGYLEKKYMLPSEKALKEDPDAKNPYRTTVNPLRAADSKQGWDQSFIGRGPLQVTHRAVYVQVIAFLDKRVQQATEEKDWETARLAREAEDALKADPRNAADPKYAFLVSAAFMQMAGGVRRSAMLKNEKNLMPDFKGKGPESSWMTGNHLESTDPIDKPALKAGAYKRAVEEFTKADAAVK